MSAFDGVAFPTQGSPLITPFWGDVDTRGTGQILYRETTDSDLLEQTRLDVLNQYPEITSFNPSSLFIATWDHVGYYDSHTDLVSNNYKGPQKKAHLLFLPSRQTLFSAY